MSLNKSLFQAIGRLENLPAIPHIARQIMSLKVTTEEGEQALLKLIDVDPIILSKVIGMANSPVYGTGRKILTLSDAVAVLGTNRVKMSALSISMMTSLKRKPPGRLNVEDLWQHCFSVAIAMDILAHFMPQAIRPSDEEVYLAGLLHDIGFLVLDFIAPELSDELHASLASEPECSLEEMEAKKLEMNHCQLGAELARNWSLPESIVTVLRYHHAASEKQEVGVQRLISLLNIAGKLLSTTGFSETMSSEITANEWQVLGIDLLKIDSIKTKIQEHINNIAPNKS